MTTTHHRIGVYGTWLWEVPQGYNPSNATSFPPDNARLVDMRGSDVEKDEEAVDAEIKKHEEHFQAVATCRPGHKLLYAIGHGDVFTIRLFENPMVRIR